MPLVNPSVERVSATSFRDATAAEWDLLVSQGQRAYVENAGDAFIQLLESQRNNPSHGLPVNNYQHSLQCATRALQNGEDEEFVITALFHDIAQDFEPYSHDKMAAAMLRPFLSPENLWIVAHHQVFQLSFRVHSRFDTRACERYREHPHYERALHFCEHYDQNCFDPDFPNEPIERFIPLVKRQFTRVMRARVEMLGLAT
ncbi:MAG: HD domain-containing protein [Gammaproteobacteria bacterium]